MLGPFLMAFALAIGLAETGGAAEPARGETLLLGRVVNDPRGVIPRMEPMARYLAGRLSAAGIEKGDIRAARDNSEMRQWLASGEVDLVSETLMSALSFERETGAEILLAEWRKKKATYRSILFVRADGPIRTLADMGGRVIAFEDPGSTSAYLLPSAILRRAGFKLIPLAAVDETVPPDRVGYVFAGSELNITAWVARGRVDAGAYSDSDWNRENRAPRSMRDNLRIIHTSEPVVRSLILVRPGMEPALRGAIRDILLGMHKDAEGRKILETYFNVVRYAEIDSETAGQINDARQLLDDLSGSPRR